MSVRAIVFVGWVVAAGRIFLEARTTDVNVVAMLSIYTAVGVMLLFGGITGCLDHLVWKRLLVGSVIVGAACWGLPNFVAYSMAQFQGWTHGRFASDPEHARVQRELMEREGADVGFFEARDKSEEILGYPDPSRSPPPGRTTAEKLRNAATISGITLVIGTLWTLILGSVFVGIPASMRRRSAAG